MGIKIICQNKKAYHNFAISNKTEAGIALLGTEVKALRQGKANLGDGWVDVDRNDEAFLMDAYIGHYEFGNQMNHEETRKRRLLLHKKEILKLSLQANAKGFAIVPLKLYFKGQRIKLEIGLGKGKKLHDKRESHKRRDADRDIARAIRHKNR